MVRQFCNHCFADKNIHRCKGCTAVAYCNADCQRADWSAASNHSGSCGLPKPASVYARIAAEHGSLVQYAQIGPAASTLALSQGVLDLKTHMSSALALMQRTPWQTALRQTWTLKHADALAVAAQQIELQLGTDLVPVDVAQLAPAWSALATTLRKMLARYFRERTAEPSAGNQFVTNLLHELLTGASTMLGSGFLQTLTIKLMKTLFSLANTVLIEPLRQLALYALHWSGSVCSHIMFRTFDVESALRDKPELQAEAAALALLGEATLHETRQRKQLGQYSAEMGNHYVARLQAFLAHFLRSCTPEVSRQVFALVQRFDFVSQFSADAFGKNLEALLEHVATFVGSFKTSWKLLVVDLLSGVQLGPSKTILLKMQINLQRVYAEVPGSTHSTGEFAGTLDELARNHHDNAALQEHIATYRELLAKLPAHTSRLQEELRSSGRYTAIVDSAINSALPALLWGNKPEAFDAELLQHCNTPLLSELAFEQMAIEHTVALLVADRNNDEEDLEAPTEEAVELAEVGLAIGARKKKKTDRDTSPVRKAKKKVAEDAVAVYAHNRAGGATLRQGEVPGAPLSLELIVRHEAPGPVTNMGPSPAPSPAPSRPGYFSSLGISGHALLAGAAMGFVVGGVCGLAYAYFGATAVAASTATTAAGAVAIANQSTDMMSTAVVLFRDAPLAIQNGMQSGASFNAVVDGRLSTAVAAVMPNGRLAETVLKVCFETADALFSSAASVQQAASRLTIDPAFDPNYLLQPDTIFTLYDAHPGSIEAIAGEMRIVWENIPPDLRQAHPWFRHTPRVLAELQTHPENYLVFGPNMQWLASLVLGSNVGQTIGPQLGPPNPTRDFVSAAFARRAKMIALGGLKLSAKGRYSMVLPMFTQWVKTQVGDPEDQFAADQCAALERFASNFTALDSNIQKHAVQAEKSARVAANHAENVNPLNWLTMDFGLNTLTTLGLLYGAYTLMQIAQTRQGRSEKTHWLKWLSLFALGVDLLCWVNPLGLATSALLRLSLFFGVAPVAALPIGIVTFLTQTVITIVQWQETGGNLGAITTYMKEKRTQALLEFYLAQQKLATAGEPFSPPPMPVTKPSQGVPGLLAEFAPDIIAVQKKKLEDQGFDAARRNAAVYPDASLHLNLGISALPPPLPAETLQSASQFTQYSREDWEKAVYL